MGIILGGALKNQSVNFPQTTIFSRNHDWAGSIDYQVVVKTTNLTGSLAVIFRWNDRNGTAVNHTASGLSFLVAGQVASTSFNVWTQHTTASAITLELTISGVIIGTPVYDIFINGDGYTFGS